MLFRDRQIHIYSNTILQDLLIMRDLHERPSENQDGLHRQDPDAPPDPPDHPDPSDPPPYSQIPNLSFLMHGLASEIPQLKILSEFIDLLLKARLEDSNMDPDQIELLQNPPQLAGDGLDDKHFLKALKMFMAMTNSSEATYEASCATNMECYPDDPFLSFKQVHRHIEKMTGISAIYHD
ncbi:hypothetical protein H0H92_008277, partial [Tricholoma furcatifolium]